MLHVEGVTQTSPEVMATPEVGCWPFSCAGRPCVGNLVTAVAGLMLAVCTCYALRRCAALGDVYTKACQDYIDVYAPALFELLEVRLYK